MIDIEIDHKLKMPGPTVLSKFDDKPSVNFYYLYYYKSERLRAVKERVFTSTQGPVFARGDKRIRVIDCNSRTRAYNKIKFLLARNFTAQSILGDFENTFVGFKMCLHIMKTLGSLKNQIKGKEKTLIVSLLKLVLEVYSLLSGQFNFTNFVQIILSIYSLHKTIFEAQSLDVLLLAGIATVLPGKLVNILRSAQLLSSMKIGDDMSIINKMVAAIFNLCEYLMEKVPKESVFRPTLDKIFGFFKNNTAHVWITQMENILVAVKKDSSKIGDPSYRLQINNVDKKVTDNPEIMDWSRRSAALNATITKWRNLMRIVDAYGQPDRQEPNCFIFEGPPGCMKSVVLNAVIKASGMTHYSHIVSSTSDGKDWYDSYNGEDIFYMDDVGQQSVSQWRTIINMVSCVKLPLPCAEASNKDKKFFASPNILVTTNMFQNLQGLTKQDCIADIHALWRRGYVFDFKHARREGNFIRGEITFKYYDISTMKFESDFPPIFKTKYPRIEPVFKIDHDKDNYKLDVISWILGIIKGFTDMKKGFVVGNQLSDADLEYIREQSSSFLAQSILDCDEPRIFEQVELDDDAVLLNFAPDTVTVEAQGGSPSRTTNVPDVTYTVREEEPYNVDEWGSPISIDIYNPFNNEEDTTDESFCVKMWASAKWFAGVITSFVQELIDTVIRAINFKDNMHIYLLIMCFIVVMGLVAGGSIFGVRKYKQQNKKKDLISKYGIDKVEEMLTKYETQSWREDFKYPDSKVSTNTQAVQRAVKEIDLVFDGVRVKGFGFVSGRHIIVPKHFVPAKTGIIIIYQDRDKNSILVDNEIFSEQWCYESDDVSVLALPRTFPSPFQNMSHFFDDHGVVGKNCIVNSFGIKYIDDGECDRLDREHSYVHKLNETIYTNKLSPKDFTYATQGAGMCGSLIFNTGAGILGMHVAGDVASNTGVAIKWSSTVRSQIKEFLISDKNIIPWSISKKVMPESSVVKLDRKMNVTVPAYTNFGPSPLYGIYPPTRGPANLQRFGKFTVKDVAKKSFSPVVTVPQVEIDFGQRVVDSFIEYYDPISEREIVLGNEFLAGLNKHSSNGFECSKLKSDYVDYEKGELTQRCRDEIRLIEESIIKRQPKWDAFVWVESLKDEIRNDEKDGVPRSFRIGTIHQQILMKKYFGGMVANLIRTREFHQIMVGMNPIKEWPAIYEKLIKCLGVFACDIAHYDGSMLTQVQRACSTSVSKKCRRPKDCPFTEDEFRFLVEFLMETLIHSLVAIMDDFVLTTHSMPSGSFLTAIFNSIVNKCYTAMWYYRYCKLNGVKPTVQDFWETVIDYVYGDDKLNGIRKYAQFLNAETMRDFFVSIGMNLTTSDKKQICVPFEDIEDITFLKRSFRYHNKLNKIVCPLDLRTLYSGLSFVDHGKDVPVVMEGKVGNFQREIFLHPDRDMLLKDFINRLEGYPLSKHQILSENYLMEIYTDPDCRLTTFMDAYL